MRYDYDNKAAATALAGPTSAVAVAVINASKINPHNPEDVQALCDALEMVIPAYVQAYNRGVASLAGE